MLILGINAYHADASAVLVADGRLVAAVEEERFRRIKHWAGIPRDASRACLDIAGVTPAMVDCFAISRNPRAHLARKALFALRNAPSWALARDRARNAARIQALREPLATTLGLTPDWVRPRLRWIEHHPAHLASAFFVSPFDEAAVCAIDGFGDFVSTSLAIGRGRGLQVLDRIYFPHSIGLLYLALTQYLGFTAYGDEYKVMGLAAYGEPDHAKALSTLIRLKPGGAFELDLSYFRHWSEGVSMTWEDGAPRIAPAYTAKLPALLGPPREPDEPLTPRHEAIAASLQAVFENALFHVLGGLHERTGLRHLCLAGGCAMNSVANGKIRERTGFERVFVQPAAADNGTALGAAFSVWHQTSREPRGFVLEHAYWGPEFTDAEIGDELRARDRELRHRQCRVREIDDEDERCRWAAAALAEERVLGWFQGRMEWGARALGNRSILADPRRIEMRECINRKIKHREKFRPFALSILEEALDEYMLGAMPDPFMIQVYPVRPDKRAVIAAVTHVDGTARIQTVNRQSNRRYWQLLSAFEKLTGVPGLLNTSFNEREPIVHRAAEALDCFLRTEIDVLIMGQYVIEKAAQL